MNIIEKYKELVENALQEYSLKTMQPAELYEPCAYILSLGGKRLRPVITLLGSHLFDGKDDEALKPALAIELFHNFSLMHDDIMDAAAIRRGKETVHLKYSTQTAILSGDSLLIQSYNMFEDLPAEKFKKVISLFTRTATELCEGQQYDMNFESQEIVTYDQYIEMITLKTGVLVGAALQIGAIVAGADDEESEKLYEFGKNIGIAFQLKDDYLDVFGQQDFGKTHAGDIIENKKTILYIKALEEADEESLKELKFWYGIKTQNVDKVYAVEKIFKRLKVDFAVMSLIGLYTEKAKENLNSIQVPEDKKEVLRELASTLIERQI